MRHKTRLGDLLFAELRFEPLENPSWSGSGIKDHSSYAHDDCGTGPRIHAIFKFGPIKITEIARRPITSTALAAIIEERECLSLD